MPDIYQHCPVYTDGRITLRLLRAADAAALLRCYADKKSVTFFIADHCGGDFTMPSVADAENAVRVWLMCYARREFVRFVIEDGETVVGTVEMFHSGSGDRPLPYGVLRVDVASPWERRDFLTALFALCGRELFAAFDVREMVTKAVPAAVERRAALEKLGYQPTAFRTDEHYFSLMQKG